MKKQAAKISRHNPDRESVSIAEFAALLSRQTPKNAAKLLEELLTPAEVRDISLRFASLKCLSSGQTQRQIAANLGISLCKITRGSRVLKDTNSICSKIFNPTNKEKTNGN